MSSLPYHRSTSLPWRFIVISTLRVDENSGFLDGVLRPTWGDILDPFFTTSRVLSFQDKQVQNIEAREGRSLKRVRRENNGTASTPRERFIGVAQGGDVAGKKWIPVLGRKSTAICGP